jgi:hypothetical protein
VAVPVGGEDADVDVVLVMLVLLGQVTRGVAVFLEVLVEGARGPMRALFVVLHLQVP